MAHPIAMTRELLLASSDTSLFLPENPGQIKRGSLEESCRSFFENIVQIEEGIDDLIPTLVSVLKEWKTQPFNMLYVSIFLSLYRNMQELDLSNWQEPFFRYFSSYLEEQGIYHRSITAFRAGVDYIFFQKDYKKNCESLEKILLKVVSQEPLEMADEIKKKNISTLKSEIRKKIFLLAAICTRKNPAKKLQNLNGEISDKVRASFPFPMDGDIFCNDLLSSHNCKMSELSYENCSLGIDFIQDYLQFLESNDRDESQLLNYFHSQIEPFRNSWREKNLHGCQRILHTLLIEFGKGDVKPVDIDRDNWEKTRHNYFLTYICAYIPPILLHIFSECEEYLDVSKQEIDTNHICQKELLEKAKELYKKGHKPESRKKTKLPDEQIDIFLTSFLDSLPLENELAFARKHFKKFVFFTEANPLLSMRSKLNHAVDLPFERLEKHLANLNEKLLAVMVDLRKIIEEKLTFHTKKVSKVLFHQRKRDAVQTLTARIEPLLEDTLFIFYLVKLGSFAQCSQKSLQESMEYEIMQDELLGGLHQLLSLLEETKNRKVPQNRVVHTNKSSKKKKKKRKKKPQSLPLKNQNAPTEKKKEIEEEEKKVSSIQSQSTKKIQASSENEQKDLRNEKKRAKAMTVLRSKNKTLRKIWDAMGKLGFTLSRTNSHRIYTHPNHPEAMIAVPNHADTIRRGTQNSILREVEKVLQ